MNVREAVSLHLVVVDQEGGGVVDSRPVEGGGWVVVNSFMVKYLLKLWHSQNSFIYTIAPRPEFLALLVNLNRPLDNKGHVSLFKFP